MGFSLAGVGFAVFWNSLPAPFTFDDDHAIVINEQIRHISTSLSATEQGSPLAGRPVVSLTFAINYAFGELNVRGYRLVNIAIHIINALLLFALAARTVRVRGIANAPELAFAIALIWMVHPLVTEPVDYVSQRTELMMATFFLLTLHFAQRADGGSKKTRPTLREDSLWLWASVAACALGMACKETMVVAPIVVLLYDRAFAFGSFREALRRRGRYYAALCATWLVLVVLLWSSPRGDSAGFAGASVSPWTYLLDQSVIIVRYLRLAFWPRGLVLDYGEPAHVTLSEVAPYVLAVAALLAGTIVALVRNRPVGFLGAWFFLTLAPTSSIMPISTEVGAERRMYLPLIAVVALAVASAARTFKVRESRSADLEGPPRSWRIAAVVMPIAALLALATYQRNAEYRSGLTLWQTVLDRWPPHARAHRNLAAELKLANRRDEEIDHLRAAVRDLPELRNVLGLELLALGRNKEAADELRIYVRDHPRDADAWSNLGNALDALGQTDEALDAFTRAVDANPNNGLSQRNLALQYLQKNDFDNAVAHAREGVRLTPGDPDAHNLLGLALIGQQKVEEAIAEFRTSLRLRPTNNDASGYLERTLKAIGR
ncbi:MAG TPA: tetratricopeptide repeat protein [Vicinamibacterales bacterium]|nr:tetratricopeptide repeat protein [Vicinamibacterales bacterium]